jgi:hypothetical protein
MFACYGLFSDVIDNETFGRLPKVMGDGNGEW